MPSGDGPISDIFVRWKHNVDHHISTTLNGVLGLPSIVSRSYGDDVGPGGAGGSTPTGPGADPGRGSASWADQQAQISECRLMRHWYEWTVSSPYSPFNLQSLPPPLPNDLPAADAEAGSPGGFADAFEDLLRVSSGQGLADHEDRRRRAREPARRSFDRRALWLADLRHSNLITPYYSAESGSGRKMIEGPSTANGSSDSSTAWLASLRRRGLYDLTFPSEVEVQSRFPHHFGTLGAWPLRASWAIGWPQSVEWRFGTDSDRERVATDDMWPDDEESLFDDIARRRQAQETGREPGNHTSTETTREADGTTTVRTREEEVDDKGNVRRLKIVTKTLDADGNEIARQTESSYVASFGGKWSWNSSGRGDVQSQASASSEQQHSGDESRKGHWPFWK